MPPEDLRVAGRRGPVVDAEPGRPLGLTWLVSCAGEQTAWQVVVRAGGALVWDSGRALGSLSRAEIPGEPLAPLTPLSAQVRVWASDGAVSPWSEPLELVTGPGQVWPGVGAVWAPPSSGGHSVPDWAVLGGTVDLDTGSEGAREVDRAALYASASDPEPARQYVYRLWCNGQRVGLGPVRSVAEERRFDGFDVTALLRAGRNRLVALCYSTAGHAFQALLVVWLRDGRVLQFGTGAGWQALADPQRRRLGELGTHHFAAPQEEIGSGTDPSRLSDPDHDHDPVRWVPVAVRPALTGLRPAPMDKVVTRLVAPASAVEVVAPSGVGREYRLDFGRTIVGGLVRPPGAVGPVTVRSGELRDAAGHARYQLSTTNVYLDRFAAPEHEEADGAGTPLWGMRVFRYADADGLPSGRRPDDLRAEEQLHRFGPVSELTASDPVLQQVWDLCVQTVRATNHHLFVDSWTREREPYEADAYAQLLANLALVGEQGVARYSLDYLLRRRTWPTEWPFFMVFAVHDHVLHTGDLAFAAEHLDALIALAPQRWLDPATGLITKPEGSDGSASSTDCDIVDWPPAERDGYVFGPVNTVINAFGYRVFTDLAELCGWLGDGRADHFAAQAAALREVINSRLFDESSGTYRDGLDVAGRPLDHHAVHAAAFCAAFGVVPDDRVDEVGAWLAARGMACSVYAAPYLVEGLFRLGRPDAAYRLITGTGPRSWAHMITLGAGATGEAWDEQTKPNLTWSHPWGASPAYLVPTHVLGVRPLQPGFGRFSVRPAALQPDASSQDKIHATLQTAVGPIDVGLERVAGGRHLTLGVPGNATAVVELDDRPPVELGPGRWLISSARRGGDWPPPEPMKESLP